MLSEAREYGFASVCVNPTWVEHAKKGLEGTDVKVCTVVGFPLGATTSAVKAFETKEAIQNGADEIDMVINVGALKSGNLALVESDIRAVVEASGDKLVKVIIEACLLTDQEKSCCLPIGPKAGADFVKTSTGFSTGGATIADVTLMRETVGSDMGSQGCWWSSFLCRCSCLCRSRCDPYRNVSWGSYFKRRIGRWRLLS